HIFLTKAHLNGLCPAASSQQATENHNASLCGFAAGLGLKGFDCEKQTMVASRDETEHKLAGLQRCGGKHRSRMPQDSQPACFSPPITGPGESYDLGSSFPPFHGEACAGLGNLAGMRKE